MFKPLLFEVSITQNGGSVCVGGGGEVNISMYFPIVINSMKHGNEDAGLVRKIKEGAIHSVIIKKNNNLLPVKYQTLF